MGEVRRNLRLRTSLVGAVLMVLGTTALAQVRESSLDRAYAAPLGIAVHSAGGAAYVAQSDGQVVEWNLATQKTVVMGEMRLRVNDVLAVGEQLVVGRQDGLWFRDAKAATTHWTRAALSEHGEVVCLASGPGGLVGVVHQTAAAVEVMRFDDGVLKLLGSWRVDSNPRAAAFTPDGKRLLVTCDSPERANRTVCIIDVSGGNSGGVLRVVLPGSSLLRGVAVAPDGGYALVAHVRPRAGLPATQVAQGWVFTNVLSYLRLDARGNDQEKHDAVALPLDEPGEFYATPFDVKISPDGAKAYVSHAGADVVSVIDLAKFVEVAEERRAGSHYATRGEDLRLTRRYVTKRLPTRAGPERLALTPDGSRLLVANRWDGSVSVIDTQRSEVIANVRLASNPMNPGERPDAQAELARRGAALFHSAKLSFQGQFACASCHPDGGSDGLNWDLPSDGTGNFYNTKSLRGIAGTEPYGWLGNSKDLVARFGGTLRALFQHEPTGDELAAIAAYLEALGESVPQSSAASTADVIARGRAIFDGKAGCARCHSGAKYADGKLHAVGSASPGDATDLFDTPSLLGVQASLPYLHDGRATRLEDVFRGPSAPGSHGRSHELSDAEMADLLAFLRSL